MITITSEESNELKAAFVNDFAHLPCCDWSVVWSMYECIRINSFIKTCEIGVFHGKSFLALAYACKHNKNNGMAIGIDPWTVEDAMQVGVEHVNIETAKVDFEKVYKDFVSKLEKYNLSQNCKIMRQRSDEALKDPIINDLDFLHIDGNHGEDAVMKDFETYYPKVRAGGIIWFDDYHPTWPGVFKTVEFVKTKCQLLPSLAGQAVFIKNEQPTIIRRQTC